MILKNLTFQKGELIFIKFKAALSTEYFLALYLWAHLSKTDFC